MRTPLKSSLCRGSLRKFQFVALLSLIIAAPMAQATSSDWGNNTKYEVGIQVGYPEIFAGAIGLRNIGGSAFFSKLYWGGFALAGELELGLSLGKKGNMKPYVSAFFSAGTWAFIGITIPVVVVVEGQAVGARYGVILSDILVLSLGAGYGWSSGSRSFVISPSRSGDGLILSATAGISLFF